MNKPSLVPPKEEQLEPSELWLALTALPRPTRELPIPRNIPGTDKPIGHVIVWPLTQEEQMMANAEADRFTKQLLKDPQKKEEANLGYQHTFTSELALQTLVRACRDSNDIKRPAFPSAKLLRREFTTDELGVLFAGYLTIQSEIGPIKATMSKEEEEALILRLVEGGTAYFFDSYSWGEQRALVRSLASRIVNCWTVIVSVGLPLDVSTFVLNQLRATQERSESEPEAASAASDNEVDET